MEEPRSSKTERPTSRRLQKSREKGQVPRSQELPPALVLGGFLLFAKVFGGTFLGSAERFVSGSIAAIASVSSAGSAGSGDAASLAGALRSSLLTGASLGTPILAFAAL